MFQKESESTMHVFLSFLAVVAGIVVTAVSVQRWLVMRNTDPTFLLKLRWLMPGDVLEDIRTGERFRVLVAPPDGAIYLSNAKVETLLAWPREKIAKKPVKFRIISHVSLPEKDPSRTTAR